MTPQVPLHRRFRHPPRALGRAVAAALLSATLSTLPSPAAAQRIATAPAGALTPTQIRALVAQAIVNQHLDDAALDEYERTERVITRDKAGETHEATSRVVPHGPIGNFRVQLERDGVPADPQTLEDQWRNVRQAMITYADPHNPQVKADQEKADRQGRELDRLKDAIGMAFDFRWVGRTTTRENRTMIELAFEPDPSYKPSLRYAVLYRHIRGTAWVDESSGHVARVEAELFEDVSFGAGIIAKLYQGARLTVNQAEVAPGVWLPTLYDFQIDGRKFLFPLSVHQQIEFSALRRVGPPREALALLERDLPAASRAARPGGATGESTDR